MLSASKCFQSLKCYEIPVCLIVSMTIRITMSYNMVGVAVAMVISTMHEKSCIDSHNARKFE